MGIKEVRKDDFMISMQFAIAAASQIYILLLAIGFLVYGNAGLSGHPLTVIFVALFCILGVFLTVIFLYVDTQQEYIERRKEKWMNKNK